MRRTTMTVGAEVLLVGLQLTAVLLILGVPDLHAATNVVSSGVASANANNSFACLRMVTPSVSRSV